MQDLDVQSLCAQAGTQVQGAAEVGGGQHRRLDLLQVREFIRAQPPGPRRLPQRAVAGSGASVMASGNAISARNWWMSNMRKRRCAPVSSELPASASTAPQPLATVMAASTLVARNASRVGGG